MTMIDVLKLKDNGDVIFDAFERFGFSKKWILDNPDCVEIENIRDYVCFGILGRKLFKFKVKFDITSKGWDICREIEFFKNSKPVNTDIDFGLLEKIEMITKRGNSAEVKQNTDGSYKVYEVRKNAV